MPSQPPTDDPLAQRQQEIERLREFKTDTSFDGDQREASDELTVVDQHPADASDMTYQRELDLTITQILDEETSQIQEARQRQEEGTYGICVDCGQPIPPERLAARPHAIRCVADQARFEATRG